MRHVCVCWQVSYDWSNAKNVWAQAHPMNCEEMLNTQAEMVLAKDPGGRPLTSPPSANALRTTRSHEHAGMPVPTSQAGLNTCALGVCASTHARSVSAPRHVVFCRDPWGAA